MKFIFDGNEWTIEDSSKTIVELAKQNGIYISAPCFYNKRQDGCCNGCLILVDGEEARACETTPIDGMNIIYDREDLMEKRTRNLTKYAARKDSASKASSCGHSHSQDGDSRGCDGSCDCGGSCGCGSH